MSGAWDDRGCTSNSADGSILHGNSVLLCKGLKKTSRLVFRDKKTKRSIIAMVTILMAIGFIMMNNVPIGRVVLVIVWIFHFLYFGLKVETVKEEKAKEIIYD